VGVADLTPFKKNPDPLPYPAPGFLTPYTRAVSLGLALSGAVIDQVKDGPTPLYAHHYETANRLLDEMAFRLSRWIQDQGFKALPIPASQILDWPSLSGHLSHKAVARMAGLGWQGKSLLLVTPQYGPRLRLVTLLTDAPLKADGPMENRCGKCQECARACPVGAIKNISTRDRYATREEALYLDRCSGRLIRENAKRPEIGKPICGICIYACPFGKKKGKIQKAATG
jgi:epoxyqueuosine reductase QueG